MAIHNLFNLARGLILRDRPIYAHYGVTSRCNLRCRTCVIWKRDPPLPELDLASVRDLAAMLKELGCVQVSLGGGEPALRPDLPDMVRTFQDAGLRTRVLTNGVALTPRVTRRLLDAGLRDISFSLDSLLPDVQEDLDNGKGTSLRRMHNLLFLAEALPRRGCMPLLNIVVTHRNFRELPALLDLCEELGFFASIIPLHLADRDHAHRFFSGAEDLRLSAEDQTDLARIYDGLLRRKLRGGRIINSSAFLRGSLRYLTTGEAPWPCRAGVQFLSISPDGLVSPCHAYEGVWGIPFRDFPRHFASEAYRREVAIRTQSCEGCFRPCWAEVGFMVFQTRAALEMARNQVLARKPRPVVRALELRQRLGLPDEEGG